MKLLFNALIKFLSGLLLVGTLVFLPAGSLEYAGGWRFIGIMFIPIFIMGIILFIKSPNLLEKRLNNKEKEKTQKSVVAFSSLVFISGFIVAGLDFRFGWSDISNIIIIIASILFLVAYCMYAEVMRENAYLSRTVEVQENQKVIDTGLYGIIRHPMYTATILLFLMIPIIMGSWYAFVIFLGYPIIIAVRIKNEEEVLTENLSGYSEYKKKVKYKLLPYIW